MRSAQFDDWNILDQKPTYEKLVLGKNRNSQSKICTEWPWRNRYPVKTSEEISWDLCETFRNSRWQESSDCEAVLSDSYKTILRIAKPQSIFIDCLHHPPYQPVQRGIRIVPCLNWQKFDNIVVTAIQKQSVKTRVKTMKLKTAHTKNQRVNVRNVKRHFTLFLLIALST